MRLHLRDFFYFQLLRNLGINIIVGNLRCQIYSHRNDAHLSVNIIRFCLY